MRVDSSSRVQGGGSGRITWEQVDTAAKIDTTSTFFFSQRLLSQFACVKYQKETIILQRQKKTNNNQENNSPFAKGRKKKWKETRNIDGSHVRVGEVSQIQAGNQTQVLIVAANQSCCEGNPLTQHARRKTTEGPDARGLSSRARRRASPRKRRRL